MGDTGYNKNKGVGKSCLTLQYIENKTKMNHDITIGVEFAAKYVHLQEKIIKL